MKIKMMFTHGCNAVKNALVDTLLSYRKPVRIEKLFIRFEVDEWSSFLNFLWVAYAAASRQSDGEAMRQRYGVSLTDDKGREWHTKVWFDEKEKCIFYTSLY